MQKSHFSSYPPGYQTPSVAYGFDVEYWNGQRLLLQSGALRGFTSLLVLLPNRKTGFFIAGNTARDAYLFDLERRFLDHFYPSRWPVTRLHTPPSLRGGLDRFTGSYWSNEYSRSTIEKLRQLVNQVQVTSAGNGTLFAHFWDGSTRRLTRLGPLLFGRIDDRNVSYWAFREDRSGRITGMAPGSNEVYDRIQWYETTRVQIIFIVVLALIFLSGAVLWLFVPLVGIALQTYPVHHRMRRGELHSSVVRGQRTNRVPSGCRPYDAPTEAVAQRRWSSESLAGWLLGLNNGLNLFFLVALLVVMLNAVSTQSLHYSWIEYGVPPGVVALLCLPLMTSALAILSAFATVLAWKSRYWSWPCRLHYSAATLGALAFIPFLHYWNLLGFHF